MRRLPTWLRSGRVLFGLAIVLVITAAPCLRRCSRRMIRTSRP